MNQFRQYVLVGGMPQSVLAFRDKKGFHLSDIAKRRILTLYREDVSKIDKFRQKFSSKIGTSYIFYPGDVMWKDQIWHLPLYMAMFL